MKHGIWVYIAAAFVFWSGTSVAIAPSDFAENYKIDLDEPLPPISELREQFRPAPVYDPKFEYYWNIGTKFDKEFARTIRSYGTRTKRLKWKGEDYLLDMIKSLPPEMYEYVGPYMHTVPGISEKILNMPGIKETKNKFPSRIASRFADIEDIEMISPALYYLLMPEIWPENQDAEEIVLPPPLPEPANRYNPELLDKIAEVIRPEDFAPGATVNDSLDSKLRTVDPDENSPLTGPDIRAFVATIGDLKEFGDSLKNQLKIIEAGYLLDAWDEARGKGVKLKHLKGIVHPCARLVQKVRLAGLSNQFDKIIAPHAFDEKSWALTCDKTIKAYRLLNMSQEVLKGVIMYRKNVYQDQLGRYNHDYGPTIAAVMQSTVESFNAPISDMLEVKKNHEVFEKTFRDNKWRLGTDTIYIY